MRSKLALSFFALSGLALLPAAGFANNAQDRDRDEDRGKVREMTGCLQKDGVSTSSWPITARRGN